MQLPSTEFVVRFQADLLALTGTSAPLAIAVSGGPDSLALLLLAAAALPGKVAAATVDHGLRSESAGEARLVAELCATLKVPHATLKVQVDAASASLQQAARQARYEALGTWMRKSGSGWLATAHHAEDQAETLMMRLLRGSGVAGLSAVRSKLPLPAPMSSAKLVRPLLGWRRAELRAIVDAAGIEPVDDPSNGDGRFDRVRVRKLLAESKWLDPVPLSRSAGALAEADQALEWTTRRLWNERVSPRGGRLLFDPNEIPPELRRRLLSRILQGLNPAGAPRGEEIGRLLDTLERGGIATLAGVKCSGGIVWRFEPAPARRPV